MGMKEDLKSHAKWLRQCGNEIAKEGHNGWGNTCFHAADSMDKHHADIQRNAEDADLRRDLLLRAQDMLMEADAALCFRTDSPSIKSMRNKFKQHANAIDAAMRSANGGESA